MEPAALHPNNTPPPTTGSRTMRNLLLIVVLIFFIGYLVILVPSLSEGSKDRLLAKVARGDAIMLTHTWDYYRMEYKKYPVPAGTTADYTSTTGAGDPLMAILTGLASHPQTKIHNPRHLQFFSSPTRALSETSHGLWITTNTVQYNDPWGRPYRVIFDADGDGNVLIPEGGGKSRTERGEVAVISLGPDGEWGNEPGQVEDIWHVK